MLYVTNCDCLCGCFIDIKATKKEIELEGENYSSYKTHGFCINCGNYSHVHNRNIVLKLPTKRNTLKLLKKYAMNQRRENELV